MTTKHNKALFIFIIFGCAVQHFNGTVIDKQFHPIFYDECDHLKAMNSENTLCKISNTGVNLILSLLAPSYNSISENFDRIKLIAVKQESQYWREITH